MFGRFRRGFWGRGLWCRLGRRRGWLRSRTLGLRAGRLLFALSVSLGAYYIQFMMFRQNGLVLSLAGFSLSVPLIDLLLPGRRYAWRAPKPVGPSLDPPRVGEPLIVRA